MPPPSQLSNLNYLSNFHVPPTVHLSIPPICQLTLFLSLPAVTLFLPSPISNWQKAVFWNSMTKHQPIGRSLICIIPHSQPLDRLLPSLFTHSYPPPLFSQGCYESRRDYRLLTVTSRSRRFWAVSSTCTGTTTTPGLVSSTCTGTTKQLA